MLSFPEVAGSVQSDLRMGVGLRELRGEKEMNHGGFWSRND